MAPQEAEHPNVPSSPPAGEALVQQIADLIEDALSDEYGTFLDGGTPSGIAHLVAPRVLPLVEAQVAPLRDERDRLRLSKGPALFTEMMDAVLARADAAESALRQVREAAGGPGATAWPNVRLDAIRTVLARVGALDQPLIPAAEMQGSQVVGAADTQPEGAGGHDCPTCEDCIHDGRKCCGCYDGACCQSPRWSEDSPEVARWKALYREQWNRAHDLEERLNESTPVYRGWRGYGDGSRSDVERWVRAANDDWVSLDSERRTDGDIILEHWSCAPDPTPTAGGKVDTAPEHVLTEYGTTRCPVERVAANADPDEDGTLVCSACGAIVPADTAPESGEGR